MPETSGRALSPKLPVCGALAEDTGLRLTWHEGAS
jgi:hypothetical protein